MKNFFLLIVKIFNNCLELVDLVCGKMENGYMNKKLICIKDVILFFLLFMRIFEINI